MKKTRFPEETAFIWKDAPDGTYGNLIWNNELVRRMFYRPSDTEIKAKFANKKNKHPYILISAEIINEIRLKEKTDKAFAKIVDFLRKKAVSYLKEPCEDFNDPTWSSIFHARRVKEKTELLGIFYLLDGDERFAKRLLEEINSVIANSWTSYNFLVASENAYTVALGYDWIYPYLDDSSKKKIENALWNLYLTPALKCYNEANGIGPDFLNHLDIEGWWTRCSSNWNMVCNGSVICVALAIADTDEMCCTLTEYALKGLPYTIVQYLPDGASEESVGYWKYAYSYYCKSMCALNTALGTDFGYFNQPVIRQTLDYPLALTGPCGTFNFHDSGIDPVADLPELFYFAKGLDMPYLAKMRIEQLNKELVSPDIYDLIWHYNPKECSHTPPEDYYFRNSETVSMRSSYKEDAFAVAFHTGYNLAIHSHLDMGSIIVDYLGERWIHDPGNERITYSERGNSVNRWDLYRMRAEGHNTIVVNPSKEPDQNINADCRIESFEFSSEISNATANLSKALNTKNALWQRTVTLDKQNCTLTVCDELNGDDIKDIYWFMHTKADCSLSEDEKSVTLRQNGKSVQLILESPGYAKFYITEAKPLPTSPDIEGQDSNDGFVKLAIHIEGKKEAIIKVTLK